MSPKWVRHLSLLNIIVNVAIIITGGAVRLTGSGLGCPSWPNCAPGTFHATQEMGLHGAIEWGNRLFGVVVALVAIATFIAAWRRRPRRDSLIWLTGIGAVGVAIQAGVGALTVNTGLAPVMVSVHFLLSMGVLAAVFAAWVRSGEPDGPARTLVPGPAWRLWQVLVAVTLGTLLLGTLVTGAGPHAGDPDAPRLGLDPAVASQAHADLVFLLVGLTIGMAFTLRAIDAPATARRRVRWLLGVQAAQGLIGIVQFYTGLPEVLVGAHLLGAALLWLTLLYLGAALRERRPRSLDELPRPEVREFAGAEA